MLGTKAGHVSEPTKKRVVVVKSKNEIGKTQIQESTAEFNPYHQHCNNVHWQNLEENKVDETYQDSEEEPEEDLEEEIYKESDKGQEDVTHEYSEEEIVEQPEEEDMYEVIDVETGEDPEEEIVEEPEEDPEEEIVEEPEEDPEEEIVEEPEEDPEEEIVEEPEEVQEAETNEESSEEGLAAENFHRSSAMSGNINSKDIGDEPNEDPEEERGKEVAEEGSSKRRKSRWDLSQNMETPEIDGNSKRRKTRWDNNDSRTSLINPSSFAYSLELTDPKTKKLETKLMKINMKLHSSVIHDERPPEDKSPSPEPVYNNLGVRINSRDARIRQKLIVKRNHIICKLATFQSHTKLVRKLFVPNKEYPSYNFIGLILGPKGNTQKKMEQESGAKIYIRGKGSGDPESADEDLHVRVEAHSQQSLEAALVMVEKLLVPVADQINDHKRAQLVELAKLRGSYKDNNICDICKEQGHKKYACPLQDSTFKAVCCDICGSFDHLAASCNEKSNKEVDHADLYVGYLAHAIDEKRLRELFLPFGKIVKTTVVKDHITGLSRGYGFVKFEDPLDAGAAIKYMNGHKMEGKMLAVRVAGQRPVVGPGLHSGHVHPNALCQTSYHYGPETSILPTAPFSIMNNISLSFPTLVGHNTSVARTQFDPRLTSPGNGFHVPNPSSLSDPVSRFPGHPDYPGSHFFAGPVMNETQNGTAARSSLLYDIRFPEKQFH